MLRIGWWWYAVGMSVLTVFTMVVVKDDHKEMRQLPEIPAERPYARPTEPAPKGPAAVSPGVVNAGSAATSASPDEFEFGPMAKIQTPNGGGGWETIEAVAVGDVTGDGRDDLIVQPYINVLRVYAQRSDGKLAAPREFRYRSDDNYLHSKDMVLADFNGDGVLDVAASGQDEPSWNHGLVNLLLSGPGGALVHRQVLTDVELPVHYWAALDVAGDGATDIVGSGNVTDYSMENICGGGSCPHLRIMYGDGKGGFTRAEDEHLREPYQINLLPATDIDGDGRRDVLYSFAGDSSRSGKTVVRLRKADGGIGEPGTVFTHDVGGGVGQTLADFTSDGQVDFFTRGLLYSRGATGSYTSTELPSYTIRSSWNAAADFDGDGMADVATVQTDFNSGTAVVVLYLQRDGGLNRYYFSSNQFELDKVNIEENALAVGDLNGDGCKDLVVSANYEGVLIFPGRNCVQRTPRMPVCDLRQPGEVPLMQTSLPAPHRSLSLNIRESAPGGGGRDTRRLER